jgi:hypothetical protein
MWVGGNKVMATQTAARFEITYTYRGEKRPVFTIEANSSEEALVRFKTIKPGVPVSEIQEVREVIINQIDKAAHQHRIETGRNRIGRLTPEVISEREIVYLNSVSDDITLRFSWPADVHDAVASRTKELGIPMPEDARPMDSGKFGGTPMYSLSTEVSFPAPTDASLIPEGGRLSKDGKRIEISRVTYSLGLRKAGFPVNVYAK